MIPMISKQTALALSFIAALVVANVSGPQYIYPTYGTSLNDRFKWTALQNSLVSTACFIGVSFSGPLCSWMIENFGITKSLRISAMLIFLGPFLLAQTYAGRLPANFILCAVYLIFTGFAGASAYLCALDSQSYNFKQRRGLSMGLTTASLGTCGVVFSQINDLLFGSDKYGQDEPVTNDSTYHFLIFLSMSMSLGILFGSFFLGPIEEMIVYQQITHNDEEHLLHHHNTAATSDNDSVESNPLLNMVDLNGELEEKKEVAEVSISGFALLRHPVGFGLFCTLFVVVGIGYVYLANIGQILNAVAEESSQHERNVHITLFSLGNCGSRAFFGGLSDIMRNKLGIHRLWIFMFAILSMLMTLTYLVSAKDAMTSESLLPCTFVISTAYGIVFGVAPATTTEFGTKVFARNWGLLLYAPAFGSQIFNILFGVLYGQQAQKQESHICYGSICYQSTFRIGIISGIIALVILSLAIYKAGLYRRRIPTIDKFN